MMLRKVALLLALAPVANAFVGSHHPQGRMSETAIQAGGYLDNLSRGPPPPPSPLPYGSGNNNNSGKNARPMDPNMNHPTEYSSSPNTNKNRRPAAIGAPSVGNGLMNGGTGGSTNLPGQYGQVDHTRPYGNCRPDWDPSGQRPTNGFTRPPRGTGPLNGGTGGSSNLPGPYNQVDHTSPYGNCRPSSNGNQNTRPTTGFVRPASVSGPLNGGIGGSSNLPGQYGQVDHTSPYGNCRPNQQPSPKGARRAVSGFTEQDYQNRRAPPMNGGTSGSARMADPYGPVDHTTPY